MKSVARLLVAFALVQIGSSQSCTQDFTTFRQCMKEEVQKNAPHVDIEQAKTSIRGCFTQAGCGTPDLSGGQFAGIRDCMKGIATRELKPEIETCVQQDVPGFTMGDPESDGDLHEVRRVVTEIAGGVIQGLQQQCQNPVSRLGTVGCLRGVKEQYGAESAAFKASLCTARDTCKSRMSSACSTQQEQVRAALCRCAKPVVDRKKDTLRQQAETCLAQKIGADQAHQLITSAQALGGQFEGKLAQHFCGAEDPCSQTGLPADHAGAGGKGGFLAALLHGRGGGR